MFRRFLAVCGLVLALALAACQALPAAQPTVVAEPTDPPPSPTSVPPTGTPTPAADPRETQAPSLGETPEPPLATLSITEQRQTAGLGSYCWNATAPDGQGVGLCVDKMGIVTPLDAIQAPTGPFTAQFHLPLDEAPTSLSLNVMPATGQVSQFEGEQAWEPQTGESYMLELSSSPAIELDLEPGRYVLALFTAWEGHGDALYGFLVEVVGEGGPPAFTLPASCVPADAQGFSPYVDPGGRYCLQFPSYFRIGDVTMDRVNFYGPALDESLEPVFAALTVQVNGPADGRTLTEIVDQAEQELSLGLDLPITRRSLTLGGQPAEVLEGLPGRALNWQAFVVHNDTIYQLSLFPADPAFSQAQPDLDAVWQAVTSTFTFLAP